MEAQNRPTFQPPVEVAIDEDKIETPHGFKLFVDDVEVNAGVTSDQLLVSRSVIYMSDMLGDRRFIAPLDAVSSFSNFDFSTSTCSVGRTGACACSTSGRSI
jgi:hypothetical protein